MSTLKDILKEAQVAYDKGNPIMSDDAFDGITNSESQFKLNDEETYTVKHHRYMGSMSKVHTKEDLLKQMPSATFAQPKFDGISCEVILEYGLLKSISTRGNGEFGKDLSTIVEAGFLKDSSWNPEITTVYGEITLKSDNPSQKDRNVVAGICNKDYPTNKEIRQLQLNIYEAYRFGDIMVPYSQIDRVYFCDSPQVRASNTYIINNNGEETNIELYEGIFNDLYPDTKRDGIVFKKEPEFYGSDEGKFELALKPQPLSSITKITDVSWKKGKSKFAATAIIEPIELGGVTISRVTLPDKYIREMDLHIGDTIEVTRAGDVIPRIVKLVKEGEYRKEIVAPNICEYGHELSKVGKSITCSVKDCTTYETDFVNKIVEIMFWGIKRAPKSKMYKLVNSGDVDIHNILEPDTYSSKLTSRELNLVNAGVENIENDLSAKALCAMNIDGLTYEKAKSIIDEYESVENYIKENSGPFSESISFILKHSSGVSGFIGYK